MKPAWHVITGEYPPTGGGVADYTATVSLALADRGAEIHVWALDGHDDSGNVDSPEGVVVHRCPRGTSLAGLARLGRALDAFPGPRRLLVQYVPHAYGWKAMNVPFAAWIYTRSLLRRDEIRVMFHEVAYPWVKSPLRHNLLAFATRSMAILLLRASSRAYVTTPSWLPTLKSLGAGKLPITWLPVPTNIPDEVPAEEVASRRLELTGDDPSVRLVCHFGTYGWTVNSVLSPILEGILSRRGDVRVVLLGRGGDGFREELIRKDAAWSRRIVAPGLLSGYEIARSLRACDLAIQPYSDGANSRRTSLMASLANGVPVLTNLGHNSEPLWSEGDVAAFPIGRDEEMVGLALELLDDRERLDELGNAGRTLYRNRFALHHTISALLDAPCPLPSPV